MSAPTPRTDAAWASSFEPCEYRAAHTARTMRDECVKLERELDAERARLDWLEKRGPWESFNKWGETGISLRENIRAAIDAAMKEGAK